MPLNSFILKIEEQLLVLDGPKENISKELHSERQHPSDRRVHRYLRTLTHWTKYSPAARGMVQHSYYTLKFVYFINLF